MPSMPSMPKVDLQAPSMPSMPKVDFKAPSLPKLDGLKAPSLDFGGQKAAEAERARLAEEEAYRWGPQPGPAV